MLIKFNQVLSILEPCFKYKNCSFGYQQKNCKKHGHFKKKTNKKTGEQKYEIRIEKNDNDAAKIYTLIHEITHLLNDHLDNKNLTYAQQEYVADYVAMYFIEELNLKKELEQSNMAKKWDIYTYSSDYLANKKINKLQHENIQLQINRTKNHLKNMFIINLK